jgi:anti-anti-sigma factor
MGDAKLSPRKFAVASEGPEKGLGLISIRGEVDLLTAKIVRAEIQANLRGGKVSGLIFDLSECDFIDSTAIALLIETQRKLSRDGLTEAHVALVVNEGPVLRSLTMCGIARVLVTCETREEARRRLNRTAGGRP